MKNPRQAQQFLEHPLTHLFLIAFVGIVAYAPVFHAPFVFDDRTSIVDNPVIRDLARFLGREGYYHHPRRFIGYLSFALNYRFGGLSVTGYHVVNLCIHVASSSLVYVLFLLTFRTLRLRTSAVAGRRPYLALLAGLLFVAHPVQTEAVTYITQRFASLAAAFYLLAMVLWVRGWLLQEESGNAARHSVVLYWSGAVVAGFVAMLIKEIAVTLPVAAFVYAALFFAAPWRRRLISLLPMIVAVVLPLALWHVTVPTGGTLVALLNESRGGSDLSRWEYFVTQLRVLVTYVRLMVVPVSQNLDYSYPVYRSLMTPPVAGSILLLLSLFLVAGRFWRHSATGTADPAARLLSLGVFWFFATQLVESSVIPLDDLIAEHRLYLPCAGLAIAVAGGAGLLANRVGAGRTSLLALCIILALGASSFRRNVVWRSPLALWRDTVAKSPGKARPHYNLATVLNDRGETADAVAHFRQSLSIRPDYADAWHNLGVAHAARGEVAEAVAAYREALRLEPGVAQSHNALGAALMEVGNLDDAIGEFLEAVRIDPGYAEARNNLGAAWGVQGKIDAAVAELKVAAGLDPGNPRIRANLSKALELKGGRDH